VYRWIAFALVSLPLVYVSRASLRKPRSHGFYRIFAWEAILGLFCLNITLWFEHPFAWYQVISWGLLCASCVPLYYGVRALITRGKPCESRTGDGSLLAFEKTTLLVTTGIYHYIRHPLYASLLYLAWGAFWKLPSWPGVALATLASLALYATAKADESECTRFFGDPYRDYMKRSKRFMPYVF
jgi:protein-S-isoprenylcysteine O-methyltransferase Ste14